MLTTYQCVKRVLMFYKKTEIIKLKLCEFENEAHRETN